jgi:threonylcarbamoyladenosine tRNA methylthiotransferase MtaB
VLFEHAEKNGTMEGYSDNYIKVVRPYDEAHINSIINTLL